MNNQAMRASVIILTKNGDLYLRALLDALASQELEGGFETIVIDSGSTDGTLKIVAEFPAVRLHAITPDEFGHGKTRNLGARLAQGEILVYLPQDATPVGDDWLEKLLRPFADRVVVGVYARQLPRAEANAMEKFFLNETYPASPASRSLAPGELPTLANCFFSTVGGAVRTAVWARYPFREDIIMSEDQAWAADVLQTGHVIAYAPNACVLHSHHYGVADVFRRNFDSGYSIRQIFFGRTGISISHALLKLARETGYVLRAGSVCEWFKFLPYEAARHIGFMAGVHAERLPLPVRKRFSSLRYFWEQRGGNGNEA